MARGGIMRVTLLIALVAITMALATSASAQPEGAPPNDGVASAAATPVPAAPPPAPPLADWLASAPLVQLAEQRYRNLTNCEGLLLYAAEHGTMLSCAPGLMDLAHIDNNNPLNEPGQSAKWPADRDVRADLLRWILSDADAQKLLSPGGFSIRGAKVMQRPILAFLKIPVWMGFDHCFFGGGIDLGAASLPGFALTGSVSGPLNLRDTTVSAALDLHNDAIVPLGVSASELVNLVNAQVGSIDMTGDAVFTYGQESGYAIRADAMFLRAGFFMRGPFITDGLISIMRASIGTDLDMQGVSFKQYKDQSNGVVLEGSSIKGDFWWVGIKVTPKTELNLNGASVGVLFDETSSWPPPGKLYIEGFVYGSIDCASFVNDCSTDADARLAWLQLQPGDRYRPQPYRELAQFLNSRGDQAGERRVLVHAQDERLRLGNLSRTQRIWEWILWATIDYGYQSSWALLWAALLVINGGILVHLGHEAGVIKPVAEPRPVRSPLVYSLDIFLPIVDLRLKRTWWPDPSARGRAKILGREVPISGRWLEVYLWFHIVAGYILSALFLAGLSGLVQKG